MFQSVYDYPYLSSSANHIFDLTVGYAAQSGLSQSSAANYNMQPKKINIYNEMAQVLVGYDETNTIRRFDSDGDFTGGTKIDEAYFFNFTRLLSKDEIKKGSFSLTLGVGQAYPNGGFRQRLLITDGSGSTSYKVNSPAGEYGILRASGSGNSALLNPDPLSGSHPKVGLIYYQAGIAVITSSVFGPLVGGTVQLKDGSSAANYGVEAVLTGSTINANCTALRHRINNISFNNTTELNSSVYFCRVNNTDFNYSGNPTYLSSSKLVVKNNANDLPVTYVTTVGLYSGDNELLAVAKLSEPLKKDPTTEFTLRVRLDY
tara:strand:+ start:7903 stop:8853 length:951 start_codon:yes stop_codon:yes gene_type:complete